MSEPAHLSSDAWKDAEAFIGRAEAVCRSEVSPDLIYEEILRGLIVTASAAAAALWVVIGEERQSLSRCGVDVSPVDDDKDHQAICSHASATPTAKWTDDFTPGDDASADSARLTAVVRLSPDTVLGLTLRFGQPASLAIRQPQQELAEVVLDLLSGVYLRAQFRAMRERECRQSDRDALVGELNAGIGLTDSMSAIAQAVAKETGADRVSLLRLDSLRAKLIAASTQPRVDRRARQIRLIEELAAAVADRCGSLTFVVGDPVEVDPAVQPSLENYLKQSGCREIHVETVTEENEPRALIVIERFRLEGETNRSSLSKLPSIREPVGDAVLRALRRDDAGWSLVATRLSRGSYRRKAAYVAAVGAVVLMLLWLVPARLQIPVEGRIEPAQSVRLFAPAEGTVVDVHVSSGDRVSEGDTIAVLRSEKLELLQKDLEGELETAKTQLASLAALRSGTATTSSRDSARSGSADEQLLKTQIAGLEKQLTLVHSQIQQLTVVAPISGRVDRWNLKQSLLARPVTHGQYLADVVSTQQGWRIELELPDRHAGYVLRKQESGPCHCRFTTMAGSDTVYESSVGEIADAAHVNRRGQSVVRVIVPYPDAGVDEFRAGSTVMAQLDCGKRSLGFVWFRGLIEWARRQSWF